MLMRPFSSGVWVSIALAGLAHAHQGAYHKAMWCAYGNDSSNPDYNNNNPSNPLYEMTYKEYWMHAHDGCNSDKAAPPPGVYMEVPSNGYVSLEIAQNVAWTEVGTYGNLSDWGDGGHYPDDYHNASCITSPNLHTHNESDAAGTALAIAYKSDINAVTLLDLVVFTVAKHTPWKRKVKYAVPPGMPLCPEEGCICVYGWVPRHCGTSNMYMNPIRCKVIPDLTPQRPLGVPQPPVYCEDDPDKCVKGPKQIIIYSQLEGDNTIAAGYGPSGELNTPMYNEDWGYYDGPQDDIFVGWNTSSVANSATMSGILALPSTAAGSSLPGWSGMSALPSAAGSSLPGWSGMSALPSTAAGSNLPGWSGMSALPSSTPGSSTPAGSGTPAWSSGTPKSSLPAGSGTPAWSSTTPKSSLPAASGTPALSSGTPKSSLPAASGTSTDLHPPTGSKTCKRSTDIPGASHAAHSKRMMMRREKNVF